ncbi:MAG: RNA 2',3'-cyclic phosphodiesterase [Candidatus Aenigmarchaeota archaeon]|nr:RNA 2',3'-cyclic phosphodiesterase [Candidatus Aenigmarchaeota archaeon]
MRLFISVEIPDELKDKIINIQKEFSNFHIKFVERENLHFCLMFIGEAGEDKLNAIKTAMNNVSKINRFDIKVAGIGAFPNKDLASVFFLDIKDGRKDMINLANALRKELPDFKSGKPFTPHLTLGRVKSDNDKLKPIFNKIERIDIGKMTVDKMVLINSTLTNKGPIYEEVLSVNLG